MKPRYTKRVREEAALTLSALAAERAAGRLLYILDILKDESPAAGLACAAFEHVTEHGGLHMEWHLHYAEAHALLMSGWSPP